MDAAVPIWQSSEARQNMVARRAGEIDRCDPGDLSGQVRKKRFRVSGTGLCNKVAHLREIPERQWCNDQPLPSCHAGFSSLS